jgi:anion-transporting  ArsA/GET3 family ATPase
MLIDEFLAPTIMIVSGKGGVGKTTVSAALALVAARHGRNVCIAEVDRKGTLPALFGARRLGYEPSELSPSVWGINITPEEALAEYLDVQYHMKRLSWVFTTTHFVDYITTAAPGFKDILILGKVWYLEQGRTKSEIDHPFDNIILDAPAAGHMLTFLQSPMGLSDALRVGPLRRQADWLIQMITDPSRTRVHLVTLAEEMSVNETLETSQALRERLGIPCGAVFANAIYSELFTPAEQQAFQSLVDGGNLQVLVDAGRRVSLELDDEDLEVLLAYERFLEARREIQARHLKALREGTGDAVVELPFLFSAGLALPDVENLADAIEEKVEKL